MSLARQLVAIAYFVEVGLLLVVVPWTGFLERNYFVQHYPIMKTLIGSGYVRGLITGFGLLNLCAGVLEFAGLFSDRHGDGGFLPGEWHEP